MKNCTHVYPSIVIEKKFVFLWYYYTSYFEKVFICLLFVSYLFIKWLLLSRYPDTAPKSNKGFQQPQCARIPCFQRFSDILFIPFVINQAHFCTSGILACTRHHLFLLFKKVNTPPDFHVHESALLNHCIPDKR